MLLVDYLPSQGNCSTSIDLLDPYSKLIWYVFLSILQRRKLRYRLVNFQLNEQLKTE